MRIAALDLGSNSFLLLIADVVGGQLKKLHDESLVTRLGQGVQATKHFHPEALKRVEACFQKFSKIIENYNVDRVVAVSTSAARDVENKSELLSLGEKFNIPIEIISGRREAELTFLGGTYDLKASPDRLVLDVGGGSTEIISKNENGEAKGFSLDIGSVRLTEMFITKQPISDNEFQSMKKYIHEQFKEHRSELPENTKEIVAVAGTPTTLACVIQGIEFNDKIHGFNLSLNDLERFLKKLSQMTVADREAMAGMQPGRADVIIAGISILIEALNYYQLTEMTVSTKGVRYGLAFEAAQQ